MKIASLYVMNFLGAVAVDVVTLAPVQLFVGRNGAGKSSLRDAIALALTADLGRVGLKKEAPALIRTGAESAVCEVKDADGDVYSVTLSAGGKITDSPKGRDSDPVLQYVLDAQRFAQLGENERRSFLFGLMGVKTDAAAVKERLAARGCDQVKVDRVAPLLRAGFDAACKEAKGKATEAKGAWRAVTGETYGSEKAKTWRAPVPDYPADVAKNFATEVQHADVALESWQQQIGGLQAEEQRRAELRKKLPGLQEHAAKVERIRTKLAADEQQLADWSEKVSKAENARTSQDALQCPCCQAWLAHRDGALVEAGPLAQASEEDIDRLPTYRHSRDLLASAVSHDKRDLEAAVRAQAEAEAIAADLANPFDTAALDNARQQAEIIKAGRAALVSKLDTLKALKTQADAAEKKTKEAAAHHADVVAWDAIADALAPDGIPGEILAEALGPINERLAQSAVDAGWLQPEIAPDMSITGAGREYRLLSESERWRVDAMLAEAIAHLSGARLLVLDRFDVLDPQGRAQLLSWLDVLAETGEIDTALVFGTLKALPSGLPSTIAAHWIENGVVGQLEAVAA